MMVACSFCRVPMLPSLHIAQHTAGTRSAFTSKKCRSLRRHPACRASAGDSASASYTNRNGVAIDQLLGNLSELRQQQQQGIADVEAEVDEYDEFEAEAEGSEWVWWREPDAEAGTGVNPEAAASSTLDGSSSSSSQKQQQPDPVTIKAPAARPMKRSTDTRAQRQAALDSKKGKQQLRTMQPSVERVKRGRKDADTLKVFDKE